MILFIGVSGSGKDTQCELLAVRTGYAHVSSGDLVRSFASDEQRQRMLQGLYLTDQDIFAMLERAFSQIPDPNKVILDGFPRTIAQAAYLLKGSALGKWQLEVAVNLDASVEVVRKRMIERGRVDDTDVAINSRIEEYQHQTIPVLDFLKANNVPVFVVDAAGSVEDVRLVINQSLATLKQEA